MKPTAARNLHDLLEQNTDFSELAGRVAAMVEVQKTLQNQWPGLRLRVLSIREGVLTLATPSAALAAKARQSEPSMLSAVRRVQPLVYQLRFRPEKALASAATSAAPRDRSIPSQALEQLQLAASQIDAGPVRSALNRLIRHQLDQ